MFPGTPAPIPIPCWALRGCSSPGIITCRVKAGAWGQPGAGHSMDLSLSPPRVLSPPPCHSLPPLPVSWSWQPQMLIAA